MDGSTIIRERNLSLLDVLAPAAGIVIFSFFASVPAGIGVTLAVALALAAFAVRYKPLPDEQRPVVLEISSQGLVIRRRWVREVELPWQDIEDMQFSRGNRGAIYLHLSLVEPGKYLGRFMRMNLCMSWYHVSVRISGLTLSPEKIALAVRDAREAFLKHAPGSKAVG